MPCPYTSDVFVLSANSEFYSCDMPYGTNASIPDILYEIYGSRTKNGKTTISNFFDIEWRQLTTQYNRLLNNGTPIAVGTFRLLESLTLEVECVNTNLIDFEISTSTGDIKGGAKVAHMFLTDRGGFVNLNTTYPDDPSINTTNTPDLKIRAYQAAWFTNDISMMFMDITDPTDKAKGTKVFERIDSELNQKWEIPVTEIDVSDYQSLSIVSKFGEHLGLTSSSTDGEKIYNNPYNVTAAEFDYPSTGHPNYRPIPAVVFLVTSLSILWLTLRFRGNMPRNHAQYSRHAK
ncbi:hypothetical protein EDB80DRAFT_774621 [Ilyonectria destructans]|nr:hypothetical protein EDB80DRAFT_774621 [Ilyonectria destructans]